MTIHCNCEHPAFDHYFETDKVANTWSLMCRECGEMCISQDWIVLSALPRPNLITDMLELLVELEWSQEYRFMKKCSICGKMKHEGHTTECKLADMINRIKKVLRRVKEEE